MSLAFRLALQLLPLLLLQVTKLVRVASVLLQLRLTRLVQLIGQTGPMPAHTRAEHIRLVTVTVPGLARGQVADRRRESGQRGHVLAAVAAALLAL